MRAFLRDELLAVGTKPLFTNLLELIPNGDWISPKEAATALGMHPDTFRDAYCDRDNPRVRIWQRLGPNGGRRILVDRASVQDLIRRGLVEAV